MESELAFTLDLQRAFRKNAISETVNRTQASSSEPVFDVIASTTSDIEHDNIIRLIYIIYSFTQQSSVPGTTHYDAYAHDSRPHPQSSVLAFHSAQNTQPTFPWPGDAQPLHLLASSLASRTSLALHSAQRPQLWRDQSHRSNPYAERGEIGDFGKLATIARQGKTRCRHISRDLPNAV
jgi:hypothetical protein